MNTESKVIDEKNCRLLEDYGFEMERKIREGNRYYKAEIRKYGMGSQKGKLLMATLDGRMEVMNELLLKTKEALSGTNESNGY